MHMATLHNKDNYYSVNAIDIFQIIARPYNSRKLQKWLAPTLFAITLLVFFCNSSTVPPDTKRKIKLYAGEI